MFQQSYAYPNRAHSIDYISHRKNLQNRIKGTHWVSLRLIRCVSLWKNGPVSLISHFGWHQPQLFYSLQLMLSPEPFRSSIQCKLVIVINNRGGTWTCCNMRMLSLLQCLLCFLARLRWIVLRSTENLKVRVNTDNEYGTKAYVFRFKCVRLKAGLGARLEYRQETIGMLSIIKDAEPPTFSIGHPPSPSSKVFERRKHQRLPV